MANSTTNTAPHQSPVTVNGLRATILHPPKQLPRMSSCGRMEQVFLRISIVAIKYSDMEAEYATLPEPIRQTLASADCGKSTQKLYAAAILAPQTSAAAISQLKDISAHLPQWPMTNESKYAPVAVKWYCKLARLLDIVLSTTELDDASYHNLFARLESEELKAKRVHELLETLQREHHEPGLFGGHHSHLRSEYDDQNRSWNALCQLVSQGEVVLEAALKLSCGTFKPTTDEFTELARPQSLPIDLVDVVWPAPGDRLDCYSWPRRWRFKWVHVLREPKTEEAPYLTIRKTHSQAMFNRASEMEPTATFTPNPHITKANGQKVSTTASVIKGPEDLIGMFSKLSVKKDPSQNPPLTNEELERVRIEWEIMKARWPAVLGSFGETQDGDWLKVVLVNVENTPNPTPGLNRSKATTTVRNQPSNDSTMAPSTYPPTGGATAGKVSEDFSSASNLQVYNEKWDSLEPKDADIPFPSPDLTRRGFLIISGIPCAKRISEQWGLQHRIVVNTKVFFFEGFGLEYKIQPKDARHPESTQIFILTADNDVDAVKRLIRHIKLKELSRWHPDRLNKRTGTAEGLDEAKGINKGVVEVRTAVQELLEECEGFLMWVEDNKLKQQKQKGKRETGRGGGNQGESKQKGGWGRGKGKSGW